MARTADSLYTVPLKKVLGLIWHGLGAVEKLLLEWMASRV